MGFDLWFFLGIATAAAVCGLIALVIGYITLRLRDDYLAIATLGVAETVRLFFLNEKWVANGSKGLYRIPEYLGDLVSPENYDYLYLAVVSVALAILYLAVQRAVRSPWGRVLRAIREDEVAAQASGKDVFAFKLQAFILGAVIMGIGGALFAHHVRFLSPSTFDPLLATFVIWAMLMLGGSGNNRGAVLGAFVVWGIWTGTQFLPGIFSNPNFRFFYDDWSTHHSGDPAAPRRHTRRRAPRIPHAPGLMPAARLQPETIVYSVIARSDSDMAISMPKIRSSLPERDCHASLVMTVYAKVSAGRWDGGEGIPNPANLIQKRGGS